MLFRSIADASGIAGTAARATTYTLSNVTYEGKEIIVHGDVAAQILSLAQTGNLSLHSTSYHNYVTSIAPQVTSVTNILPIKLLSCNALFFMFRDEADIVNFNEYSLNRLCLGSTTAVAIATPAWSNGLGTFQLVIGSERVPQKPLTNQCDYMAELMNAFGEFDEVASGFAAQFGAGGGYGDTYNSTINGSFAIGIDLDAFTESSDTVRSGRNTTGDTIYYEIRSSQALSPAGANTRVNTFAMHDCRYNFQPGGILLWIY